MHKGKVDKKYVTVRLYKVKKYIEYLHVLMYVYVNCS